VKSNVAQQTRLLVGFLSRLMNASIPLTSWPRADTLEPTAMAYGERVETGSSPVGAALCLVRPVVCGSQHHEESRNEPQQLEAWAMQDQTKVVLSYFNNNLFNFKFWLLNKCTSKLVFGFGLSIDTSELYCSIFPCKKIFY
jgi:hypothetical protein